LRKTDIGGFDNMADTVINNMMLGWPLLDMNQIISGQIVDDIAIGGAMPHSETDPHRLYFRRSPDVSVRSAESLIAALGPEFLPLAGVIRSGAMVEEFSRALLLGGFSATRFDDVMAGVMLTFYEVVHQTDTAPMSDGYGPFRDHLTAALLAEPDLSSVADADLQHQAEMLINLAMLAALGNQAFQGQAANTAEAHHFREKVRETAAALGFDVGLVRFTAEGFIRR
jgi:hypothetical protein